MKELEIMKRNEVEKEGGSRGTCKERKGKAKSI